MHRISLGGFFLKKKKNIRNKSKFDPQMAGFPDEQQLREYEALVAAEIREQNERVGVRIGSWRPLTDGERDVAASASTSMSTSASGMDMEMEMGFELNAQSRSRSRSQLRQTPQEEVEQFSRELEQFNLQYNEVMNSLQGDGTLNSGMTENLTILTPRTNHLFFFTFILRWLFNG